MRRALTLILLLAWTGGPWIRPVPAGAGGPACGCSMMAAACPLGASGRPGCCSGHGGICSMRQQEHPRRSEAPGPESPLVRWGLSASGELAVPDVVALHAPLEAPRFAHHEGPSPPTPPPRRPSLV